MKECQMLHTYVLTKYFNESAIKDVKAINYSYRLHQNIVNFV